jgi:Zinc finger, C3HC4 type (RING finger)
MRCQICRRKYGRRLFTFQCGHTVCFNCNWDRSDTMRWFICAICQELSERDHVRETFFQGAKELSEESQSECSCVVCMNPMIELLSIQMHTPVPMNPVLPPPLIKRERIDQKHHEDRDIRIFY